MLNTGRYYGYPECCIKQLIDDCNIGIKFVDRKNRLKASKNGFVPCSKHADLINNNKISISSIIKNRLCSQPFEKISFKLY